jgi:15-cis-phytoene desaturase
MSAKVAVLGGGVAGMSAAHELVRRGFTVEIFESLAIPGGKARSMPVPGSSTHGRPPLPGEHGFRFFPRFYRHITATMQEIPLGDGRFVIDNLQETTRIEMARFDTSSLVVLAGFPQSLRDVTVIIQDLLLGADIGIPDAEILFFAERVWQIITSCSTRRMNEYEKIGWWEFIGAATRSVAYQRLLGAGLTRSLVAAQATQASTRTVGHILILLLFNMLEPGVTCDRVLNAPTNEAWIGPWKSYLESLGVRYHLGAELKAIHCALGSIAYVSVAQSGVEQKITADYFVMALPVERFAPLITDELANLDPTLENVKRLGRNADLQGGSAGGTQDIEYLGWMNGAQFYLYEDVPLIHGHVIYVDSPWALTSISQKQFWRTVDLAGYGDGTVKGVLSVDISCWDTPGVLFNKSAKECTLEEIKNEVWAQLKRSLNVCGLVLLRDENLHSWFLDADIEFVAPSDPNTYKKHNAQPLLVNLVNSWHLRPNAYTRIPNLFLASDYVQTNTDLATMEGANEAARRAVNAIISVSRVKQAYCRIWTLHEPYIFLIWRWVDARRYAKGLPWKLTMPWWAIFLHRLICLTAGVLYWGVTRLRALINQIRGKCQVLVRPTRPKGTP